MTTMVLVPFKIFLKECLRHWTPHFYILYPLKVVAVGEASMIHLLPSGSEQHEVLLFGSI